ncbi:MAG: hypothetical protein AB7Q17_13140 [Phycisphaerae bacterium]
MDRDRQIGFVLFAWLATAAAIADGPKAYVVTGYAKNDKDAADHQGLADEAESDLEAAGYKVTRVNRANKQQIKDAINDPDARALVFINHGASGSATVGGQGAEGAVELVTASQFGVLDHYDIVTIHACDQCQEDWMDVFPDAEFHSWKGCIYVSDELAWQKDKVYPPATQPSTGSSTGDRHKDEEDGEFPEEDQGLNVSHHSVAGNWPMDPGLAGLFGERSMNFYVTDDVFANRQLVYSALISDGSIIANALNTPAPSPDFNVLMPFDAYMAVIANPYLLLNPGSFGTLIQVEPLVGGLDLDATYRGLRRNLFYVTDVGACCLGTGCTLMTQFDCQNAGGQYLGLGTACPPNIDGSWDHAYGVPRAAQDAQTGFGDSNLGLVDAANGSELDGAYAVFTRCGEPRMNLLLTGNLESNFNKLEIFFDTRPGGQNRLRGDNPNVDFNALNRMGDDGSNNGLTFDENFAADFWMGVTGGGAPYALYANYAELSSDGNPGIGRYLGTTSAGGPGQLLDGDNPHNVRATINNQNVGGVSGGFGPGSGGEFVRTGVEISIPLSALGDANGWIRVCAFVNGGGHDFVSNQVLRGIGASGNLGEPRAVKFDMIAGQQWVAFKVPDPEPGACCMPDSTCFVASAADCFNFGGTYQGNAVPCGSCGGGPCAGVLAGDSNGDGFVNNFDIDPFVLALIDPAGYTALFCGGDPQCVICRNDMNADGAVNNFDIDPFVLCLVSGSCP